jgi:hypothetical protein
VPYVDPQTVNNPTAGQPATAAWGDAVRDATLYLATNKPHTRVYNNAAFTHNSTGNWVSITFNSETFDVGSCHSTVTNTSRLTVPTGEGGHYMIGGHATFDTNVTGRRMLRLYLNGTTVISQVELGVNGGEAGGALSSYYALAAADYVELQAFQSSGGNLNIIATPTPTFWWKWDATA